MGPANSPLGSATARPTNGGQVGLAREGERGGAAAGTANPAVRPTGLLRVRREKPGELVPRLSPLLLPLAASLADRRPKRSRLRSRAGSAGSRPGLAAARRSPGPPRGPADPGRGPPGPARSRRRLGWQRALMPCGWAVGGATGERCRPSRGPGRLGRRRRAHVLGRCRGSGSCPGRRPPGVACRRVRGRPGPGSARGRGCTPVAASRSPRTRGSPLRRRSSTSLGGRSGTWPRRARRPQPDHAGPTSRDEPHTGRRRGPPEIRRGGRSFCQPSNVVGGSSAP